MNAWVLYAFASMGFAGFTAVIAKAGLAGISAELGLTVRTLFVCGFVILFALGFVPPASWCALTRANLVWLGLSGATTALSWIFYYKALKTGNVATVALIDKGSVIVAMLLAWLLLKESLTPRMLLGAGFMVTGLLILVRKP